MRTRLSNTAFGPFKQSLKNYVFMNFLEQFYEKYTEHLCLTIIVLTRKCKTRFNSFQGFVKKILPILFLGIIFFLKILTKCRPKSGFQKKKNKFPKTFLQTCCLCYVKTSFMKKC